jgi:CheY-like chemotaxis protein
MQGTRPFTEHPASVSSDAVRLVSGTGALAGVSVLVVDDDQDARELITTTLGHAGATVVAASSMQEAIAFVQQSAPQAIVSDIAMPSGTGYDFIREIRRVSKTARIPAIALTAFGRVEDRERALAAGFNLHMTKPVDPQNLVEAIAAALRS